MERTLRLTSPYTKGDDVGYAQRLLADGADSRQVFGEPWYRGPVDDTFGPLTGDACKAAKWQLGYIAENCDPTFGTDLENLLVGDVEPSPDKRKRAAERAAQTPIGAEAVDWLAPHLGMREHPPGSNWNEFVEWYGMGPEPWCGVTVTRAMVAVGSKAWHRGGFCDYVPDILRSAQSKAHGLMLIDFERARKGDLFVVDWNHGNGRNPDAFDHVGFVRGKVDRTSFGTREGNSSGMLRDQTRSLGAGTFRFIRPTA